MAISVETVPTQVYDPIRVYAAQRGYIVVNPQLSLFNPPSSDLFWVFDLALPESPHKPRVRVFWTEVPIKELKPVHTQTARAITQDKSISFLAFTNDGSSYRTIATIGSELGSIDFIPRAFSNGSRLRGIQTLSDLQPFLSIYELRQLVAKLSDSIYSTYGHDRLKLFDTILLLLATKIYDEVQHPEDLQLPKLLKKQGAELREDFQAFAAHALKSMQCESFGSQMYLDAANLRTNIEMLLPYSFRLTVDIGAQTEVLGTFYQEAVSSTFRGSLGAYFTPKPLADLATAICEPGNADTILDLSCGSGTFLLSAFSLAKQGDSLGVGDGPALFGCDIQERMVLTATLNAFLHGVYQPHIIHGDALRIDLERWHAQDSVVPKEGFSLIVGNPPFAGFESEEFLPYNHDSLTTQRGAGSRVNKIIPFIVKTVQLLRPSGRAALVIPTSVLNGEAASFADLRKWFASEVEVTAIVGLPREAFVHTDCGVEGAILFFRRRSGSDAGSKVFFKNLTNLGYDRRGQIISGSELGETVELWKRHTEADGCWLPLEELYQLDRWDATWLTGYKSGTASYSQTTHVRLTDLCTVAKRSLRKQDIQPDAVYRYFEVADTDIDTGAITHIHTITGRDLPNKGRLQIPVEEGDVLLPNHRDSLIAKTAARTGRSAVLVTSREAGCITSNRFTLLKPVIHPKLLIFVLNSELARRQLALHARGSASFDIRDKVLEEVWVPRNILEDRRFQQEVLAAIEERERLQQQLDAADAHLSQLMEALSVVS
jgi:tRNA1(Val) A37 N6-methylase TrmN6